jgi:dihydrofolate synthase / folylpolyglutamate synthase
MSRILDSRLHLRYRLTNIASGTTKEGHAVNYREAIAYVIERSGYDKGFVANPFDAETVGLRRTEALLTMLDRPDRNYPKIHIAGSKGKGSTAATLSSILVAAGYRVGLYTTPHLHTFRERIQINGESIAEEVFADLTAELIPLNQRLAEEHPEWGEATAFEVSTALAFLAFARAGAEIAVIEVGLGGRLDATNVIDPMISVITSISLDHTSILGASLGEIAAEKGGIIKPGRPVITASLPADAMDVIRLIAEDSHAPLIQGGKDWVVDGEPDKFTVRYGQSEHTDLAISLRGQHQVENAGLVVATLDHLAAQGVTISEDALRRGLETVTWPGRFERIHDDPTIIVDGAHNVDSINRLVLTLSTEYPEHRPAFILGIAKDKDIPGMLSHLVPAASSIVATASRSPRATPPDHLIAAVREIDDQLTATTAETVFDAITRLREHVPPDGIICITGSLYVVAEAREALGLAEPADFEQELLYR